jgi:hypothetical protein
MVKAMLSLQQAVVANRIVETSRLATFFYTNGGEVFSLKRRPTAIYSQEDCWYLFLLGAESTSGPNTVAGETW